MSPEIKKPIIDHVPTAEELQQNPMYANRSSMSSKLEQHWGVDANQDTEVLESMAKELAFAELNGDVVASLYDVSRHVGDMVVAGDPQNGQAAFDVIEHSRWWSRPREFSEISERHKGKASGTHNESKRLLTQDVEGLRQTSKDLFDQLGRAGLPLRDVKHAYLATYLTVAAHESGHALLAGVGAMEKSMRPSDEHLLATSMFLAKHPEVGFTGDWKEDVRAHEERFAEGYARLVVTESLKTLGYSEEVYSRIYAIIEPGMTGESQWEKGYTAPLTKEGVAAQLAEIDTMMRNSEIPILPTADDWKNSVESNQLGSIRAHVTGEIEPTAQVNLIGADQEATMTQEVGQDRPRMLRRIGHAILARTTAIISR